MGNICTFSSKNSTPNNTTNKKVDFDPVVENISTDATAPDQDQDQDVNKELLEFVEGKKPLLNIPRKSSRSDPPKASCIELSKDSIVNSVISKFIERSNLGFKKYGKTLDRKDLTPKEWVQHMEEELMDAILYLEKLRTEINAYELEEKNSNASVEDDIKIAPSKQNPVVPIYKMPEEWDHFVSLHENSTNTSTSAMA